MDTWRYESALFGKSENNKWLSLSNRNESLSIAEDGQGVQCNWRWTSRLHAIEFILPWGRRLLQRALARYPIVIKPLVESFRATESPGLSFVIGHRGLERLPLLLTTLHSIAGQSDARIECIVIEESSRNEVERMLPAWVNYLHLDVDSKEQPYNRSRTFNAGAKLARGRLLVFHDNDMLVPSDYAIELLKYLKAGYEVINLKRFIFYLTKDHTQEIVKRGSITVRAPDFVVQNLTGGGSLAVERQAFFELGGFDEGFVGWGGEDVEFWDRAQLLKVNNFGYLPFIHLWHLAQYTKLKTAENPNLIRLSKMLDVPRHERAERLRPRLLGSDSFTLY